MNVSLDVSIASLDMRLRGVEEDEKALISLTQMRQQNLRADLPQIFQSCTFNRSVTSPLYKFKHLHGPASRLIPECLQNVSTGLLGSFCKLTTARRQGQRRFAKAWQRIAKELMEVLRVIFLSSPTQ